MSTLMMRPTLLRRQCAGCGQEYRHGPVTADGDCNGERTHLIACSWVCLETMVYELGERASQ